MGEDGRVHVVAAPDKMRGTATAREIADAICRAATDAGATCDAAPVADGGEGILDVLGGANRTTTVTGPLGAPVEAGWRLAGRTAVIEMARASGLALTGEANDAVAATTRGTGELITAAIEGGARRILIGLGGSATTDGGLGCLDAVTVPRLRGIDLVVACDVRTTFVDAARVYGPQKGATGAQVDLLTRRLERLVDDYHERFGVDVAALEGGGAAGGLAGALAAVGGRLVPGFELVADELDLEERIERADLVVTAEGFLDAQSFEGKVVGGLLEMCTALDVPLLVVAGRIFDGAEGRVDAVSLVDEVGEERALHDTLAAITEVVARALS
jgi:glycerate kinase